MKLFRFRKPAQEVPSLGEVVIIDDTPENLHLLNDILSERGYKVRALPNGQMGISACQASPPDLVLLDITMPGMNGYEVAEKLKEDPITREIPIIFISAMTQTEDKIRAFDAGGVDYVTKPLQVEEVMARVETHLSISRMREQINQANEKLLAWNVKLSQPTGVPSSAPLAVPEGLAEAFGKSASDLAEGDRAQTTLTILAAHSPSDEVLQKVSDDFLANREGHVIARFGSLLVGISGRNSEELANWIEGEYQAEDLSLSLGEGEGILHVAESDSVPGKLELDFHSPAILETLSALGDS